MSDDELRADELAEVMEVAARLKLGPLERETTVDARVIADLTAEGDLSEELVGQARGIVRRRRRLRRGALAALVGLAIVAGSSPAWAPRLFAPPQAAEPFRAPAPPPPLDPLVAAAQAAKLAESATRARSERREVEALALARKAVALRPGDAHLLTVLADCLKSAKLEDEAEATYRQVLASGADKHSEGALRGLIMLLEDGERAEREEALRLYKRLFAQGVPTQSDHIRHAALLQALGRTEEAIASYRRGIAVDPSSSYARFQLVELLTRLGRDKEAMAELQEQARREPRSAQPLWAIARLHARVGRTREATEAAWQAANIDPAAGDNVPYEVRALYQQLGPSARLSDFLERWLAARPQAGAVHAALVQELIQQQRLTEAEKAARRWLVAVPGAAADANAQLGAVLARRGAEREAVAAYEAALRTAPRKAHVWNGLVQLYMERGRNDEALAAARRAVQATDASDPAARLALAAVYEKLGKNDEAIATFREAAGVDAGNAEPWRQLARLYARLGRKDEAITAYDEAFRRAEAWQRDNIATEREKLRSRP